MPEILRERRRREAVAGIDAFRASSIETDDVHVRLARIFAPYECDPSALRIETDDSVYRPRPVRKRAHERAVGCAQLEPAHAGDLAAPHELASAADEAEVVVEVDPRRRLFDQNRFRLAGRDVERTQLQPLLMSVEQLREQPPVRVPVDARQILGVAEIHPRHLTARGGNHAEPHARVLLTGEWVSVLLGLGTVARPVWDNEWRDMTLVGLLEREERPVVVPPEPPEACQLLLRDELGEAVRQVRLPVERESSFFTARNVQGVQLAVSHERDVIAGGRQLRIGAARAEQARDAVVDQPHVPQEWNEDHRRALCPPVRRDARGRLPLPLATERFFVRYRCVGYAGAARRGEQDALLACLHVM